ncbi:MAG: hypothetical protein ABL921_12500 [Pirellula sp.]
MKPQRAKAKRTLADFLKRKDSNEPDTDEIDIATDLVRSELGDVAPDPETLTANQPITLPRRARKAKSITEPTTKPELDHDEILRQREAQIQEAVQAAKQPETVSRKEAQARDLLRAIIELDDFQSSALRWARSESVCWEGAWLGAVAPIAAAAVQRFHRPLLVVLAQHQDAETVARDLDFFLERNSDVFPPSSDEVEEDMLQQQEVIQRLQVLSRLDAARSQSPADQSADVPVIVTTIPALMHRVPSPQQLRHDRRTIRVGQRIDLSDLKKWLAASGYRTTTSVQLAGEFTARGGILDVFPPDCGEPRRIELFDDEVESIRSFDSVTQRSLNRMDRVDLIAANEAIKEEASLLDYLPKNTMVLVSEPVAAMHNANAFKARIPFPERFRDPNDLYQQLIQFSFAQITQLASEGYLGELVRIPIGDVSRIGGELETLAKDIDHALGKQRTALIVCINEGELSRIHDLMLHSQAFVEKRVEIVIGLLSCGFELAPSGPFVLTVNQLLKRSSMRREPLIVSSTCVKVTLSSTYPMVSASIAVWS